jgi:hypothetical protein
MRRNWRNEAQTAIDELKNSKYGERETALRSLAHKLKYKTDDPSSLRRGIAAHEFLERLRQSHPVEYEGLRDVPLSVAELIARWYAADPASALTTASDWARGRETVQSIRDKMEASLPKGFKGLVGTAHERAYREYALEQVRSALQDLTGEKIITSTTRQRDLLSGLKFDFSFDISSPNNPAKAAVLLVGPYKNHNMYRDRCDEWVERAFALAWVFDRVMLALPKVPDKARDRATHSTSASRAIPDYLKIYKDRIEMIIRAVLKRQYIPIAEPGNPPKPTTEPGYLPKVYVAYIYEPLILSESEGLSHV